MDGFIFAAWAKIAGFIISLHFNFALCCFFMKQKMNAWFDGFQLFKQNSKSYKNNAKHCKGS